MAVPSASSEYKYVNLKVTGGEPPGTTLVQKIGPMGIPPKVVGEDIKKATSEFKSLKVHVRLAIKDRKAQVEVIPSTATLILKALREPPRDRKKVKNIVHNGNISMTDVINIARTKSEKSKSARFEGIVMEVLGTCVSIGCRVDDKSPKDLISDIKQGEIKLPAQ